jgi:peptide/nickel transport system substrate-binding protein
MKARTSTVWLLITLFLVASLVVGCGPTPEPQIVEKQVTKMVTEKIVETVMVEASPQVVEKEVTSVVQVEKVVTATPEPEKVPQVGGTLVIVPLAQPDTLDQQVTAGGSFTWSILQLLGGTLIHQDPETGQWIPYLADSWTTSEDGLIYEFKLKQGVKFHDGEPLTAQDWVYTIERALDPDTGAAQAAARWGSIVSAEAVDDYTLRLSLAEPYAPFLYDIAGATQQPLSRASVERWGADYGTHPVGVGPYIFEEWVTGTRVVLKRNPDFDWGPAYTHGGPPYIETIEFRFIGEDATIQAGLEAGEVDQAYVAASDIARFEGSDQFRILAASYAGIRPYVAMNVTHPPFDDLRVRRAFNLSVDRESLIKLVIQGRGKPQYGPISDPISGYWPGVEYIGYGYDLEKARSLMAEAGWSDSDGDGILEKEGIPLELVLYVRGDSLEFVRTAEVLKEQYRELGVDATIEQVDLGILLDQTFVEGDFDICIWGLGYDDADLMYLMFHSSTAGASCCNMGRVLNPELDQILEQTRLATTPEQRRKAIEEAQRLIIEQAYIAPIYQGFTYYVVNSRVKDVIFSDYGGSRFRLEWFDAYILEE